MREMGTAIFRAEKRKSGGAAAMARHALRDGKPVPNAVQGMRPEVLAGASTSAAVISRIRELEGAAKAAGQRLRADTTKAMDLLFTYTHGAVKEVDEAAFFQKCLAWVRHRWPTAEILTAAVHRDESTPHLQVLLAPLDSKGVFNAKALMGGPGAFRAHQDAYWEACGKPYGLSRGEKGSTAKHTSIKKFYEHLVTAGSDKSLQFEPVPALPDKTLRSIADGSYADAKREREEVRARNEKKMARMQTLARTGRALHPDLVARAAARYRDAVKLETDAAEKLKAATAMLDQARQLELEARNSRVAADHLWDKNGAQVLDRWTKTMDPKIVDQLARQLGIDLVPGKPVIDQMRRQGRGDTLIQCAALLDATLTRMGTDAPRPGQGQQQAPAVRERGG